MEQQARPRNLPFHFDTSRTGIVSLAGPPVAAAEIRYAIFNATSPRPTAEPEVVGAISLEEKGVASIMEIDTTRRITPGTGRKKNSEHWPKYGQWRDDDRGHAGPLLVGACHPRGEP